MKSEGSLLSQLLSLVGAHGGSSQPCIVSMEAVYVARSELEPPVLPSWLLSFYSDQGLLKSVRIPWTIGKLELYGLTDLPKAQIGYRWEGNPPVKSPEWSETWLVVASISGDPFLVDLASKTNCVFFARHGNTVWEPRVFSSSLETFVGSLIAFGEVLLNDFDRDVWEDSGLVPAFLLAVEERLSVGLSTGEDVERFMSLLRGE